MKVDRKKLKWYYDEDIFMSHNPERSDDIYWTSLNALSNQASRPPPFYNTSAYEERLIPPRNLCLDHDENPPSSMNHSSLIVTRSVRPSIKPFQYESLPPRHTIKSQLKTESRFSIESSIKDQSPCTSCSSPSSCSAFDFSNQSVVPSHQLISYAFSPKQRLASLIGPRKKQTAILQKPPFVTSVDYPTEYLQDHYLFQTRSSRNVPPVNPLIRLETEGFLDSENVPDDVSKHVDQDKIFSTSFEPFNKFMDPLFNTGTHRIPETLNTERTTTNSTKTSLLAEKLHLPVNPEESVAEESKKLPVLLGLKKTREDHSFMDTISNQDTSVKKWFPPSQGAKKDVLPIQHVSESFDLKYHLSTQCGVSSLSSLSSVPSLSEFDSEENPSSTVAQQQFKQVFTNSINSRVQTLASRLSSSKSCKTKISGLVTPWQNAIEVQPKTTLFYTHDMEWTDSLVHYKLSMMLLKELDLCLSFALNPVELHFLSTVTRDKNSRCKNLKLTKINTGTFCTVYKARYGFEDVAVKCPQHNPEIGDPSMMYMRSVKEWRILGKLQSHPNIVKLIGGIVMSPVDVWLVTEYIDGGDLYTRLYSNDPTTSLSSTQRLLVMKQIAFAVSGLHSAQPKIVHKDLKVNNVLLTWDNRVRLCDFGDAEEVEENTPLTSYTAVTWQYASPEVIFSTDPSLPIPGSSEKVDIWSLGCIFLELCYRSTPFRSVLMSVNPSEHKTSLQNYLNKTFDMNNIALQHIQVQLPCYLRQLIEACLYLDPALRPTATQIYGFITQHEYDLYEDILQAYTGCTE